MYGLYMKKAHLKKEKAVTAPCSVTYVAELLSDTWTILIIHHMIRHRHLRFCELERLLSGISTRTLTLKLAYLEKERVVSKTEEGYEITPRGLSLRPVLKAMEKVV
jgi:DNA-binding HxlR family transcriptional regulator